MTSTDLIRALIVSPLLNLSENYHKAKNFDKLGIEVGSVTLNLQKMMKIDSDRKPVQLYSIQFN